MRYTIAFCLLLMATSTQAAQLIGKASTRALTGLLKQGEVLCSGNQKDVYNRLLVFCTINGINVNQWILSKGWAFACGYF